MTGAESVPVDAPARPDPARRRFGAPDPWLLVSCGVALTVYLVHGFNGRLITDMAVYSYAGQQVAEGHLPYETIINRSGPLSHAVPGLGAWIARLVGVDDVLGMRVLFLVLSVISIGLAYVLARDLFRWRPAGLAAAATLLSFHGFTEYATYGPREKTMLVLCLLALMLALLRGRWVTAGVWVSLATLTWQPTFLLAMTGAVVAIGLSLPSGRWRALARVLLGGLVPTGLVVAAYVVAGELDTLLQGFLIINLEYTNQPGLLDAFEPASRKTLEGYGLSIWGFGLGMVALLVLSARALSQVRRGPDPHRAVLISAGAMLAAGLLWSVRAYNSWPDTFILMPMAALGIGGLVAWVRERVEPKAALAVALVWVLFASGVGLAYWWSARDTSYPENRADFESVLALLPPDARILAIESPQTLVIARKQNISRYQLLGFGLMNHLEDNFPGGQQGFVDWVVEEKPDLVVVGALSWVRWLSDALKEDYRVVGASQGRIWMVPRDLDEQTTEKLRSTIEREFADD